MKYAFLTVIALYLVTANGVATAAPPALQVMLQGATSLELRRLTEKVGGTVTHDLPIINAVGATLTRTQLDEALKSPLVTRHIDDLAMKYPTEPAPANHCQVGGALELDFRHQAVSWTLFNKLDDPAKLQSIAVSWPRALGHISNITLGNTKIASAASLHKQTPGSLTLNFTATKMPALLGRQALVLQFSDVKAETGSSHPAQSDFSIKADFSGDCTAKLIPGYPDNHNDFYYARLAGANALHKQGITGRGVTVAVLDSGLWDVPALTNRTDGEPRVLARYNAITDTEGGVVFDESGHGTHMTSIMAHSGKISGPGKPKGTFKGIAPDINLVAVKAFDAVGQGGLLDIVRAIQWVIENRQAYGIKVLNLSFAARPRWHYWEDPINQAIMRAWAAGITVIAAAGNEGPDPMTIGSPGNLPYAITVGAVTDSWTPATRDDDYIPAFSSQGPTPDGHIKPDIVALGGHMTGITRPGSTLTRDHPEYLLRSGEFVMTGTSQAAAVASGIAALLLQLQPELTPDDIKCKFITSAEPAINSDGLLSYSPFQQGHGMLNATRAVTLGETGCGNAGMDIARDIAGIQHYQGPAIVAEDGTATLPGLTHMVSTDSSPEGFSSSRRWGVKEYIERQITDRPEQPPEDLPFDWLGQYLQEKAIIEKLAHNPELSSSEP